tara:strand:+ start:537 stop:1121 length:585 start_codon:yes stop_codon:yes gene_type:complete
MTKTIDFYFDFISPYSYLAFKKLKKQNYNNEKFIKYKPVLLGGLHKLGGITAPAFNERKLKNMKNDCELVALKNDIEFIWNSKFPINTLNLMRGYILLEEKFKSKFFEICFDAYWKDDIDISQEKNIDKILKETGIDKNFFYRNIQNIEIKEKLKNLTNEAFDSDIFGAPTFVVNKKIFWGQDRLDYALDEYNS